MVMALYVISVITTIAFSIDSASMIGVLLLAMSEMSENRHSCHGLDGGSVVGGRMLPSWN